MGTFIKPFDFKTIFLDYFLGNQVLFASAFVIIFSFIAATLKMSNKLYFILLILGSIMFAVYLGEAIYVLVLILVGFIIFKLIGKLVT